MSATIVGSMVALLFSTYNPDIGGGQILFYTTDGEFRGSANVGHLPDMVTFLPNGNKVITANEGEPNDDYSIDPKGSVSIITLNRQGSDVVKKVKNARFYRCYSASRCQNKT